jgi:hypothetical protein
LFLYGPTTTLCTSTSAFDQWSVFDGVAAMVQVWHAGSLNGRAVRVVWLSMERRRVATVLQACHRDGNGS